MTTDDREDVTTDERTTTSDEDTTTTSDEDTTTTSDEDDETVVLKLGGSVVTEKDRRETLDAAALSDVAAAVAAADVGELVVVHGGGSFGHPTAEERGVSATAGTRDAAALAAVHAAMGRLNAAVVGRLHEAGTPALPVAPLSMARRDADGDLALSAESVRVALAEGFVPVLYGDVVVHAGRGGTVVSGDELVVALAEALDADRVGVCSTVPGVLDDEGEVVGEVSDVADVATYLAGSDATDVTGGMAGKVRALAGLETAASVFGPADLRAFLDGGMPGTTVR